MHWLRMLKSMIMLCIFSIGASQNPFELDRFSPPKVNFAAWNIVNENDEFTEYVVQFPSALITGAKENDTVQCRILLPTERSGPTPMVMILHYWGAPNLRVERALARELNQAGLGAAILTLPYHLSRTPAGAVSGALAIQPDPDHLNRTMTQSVLDVRRSLDFIQSRPECGRIVGIYGTSLGAIISSLTFAIDSRLENAAFLLGGIDLTNILWNSSLTGSIKDALKKKGIDEGKLRSALQVVEPEQYLRSKPVGQTFVIRAKFDSVIPAASTDALLKALPNSKVLEIDTGHYGGVIVQGRLLREAAQFFIKVSQGKEYDPPLRLVSPTIRIGMMARTGGHFDIAAGFDLIKFDRMGKTYASFLLTPRNPVLWIGSEVTKGVNLGIGISDRQSGFGFFFSTVL